MEPSVVTKVVTDELSITTRFINGLKELAMTRGIDFLEALIIVLAVAVPVLPAPKMIMEVVILICIPAL